MAKRRLHSSWVPATPRLANLVTTILVTTVLAAAPAQAYWFLPGFDSQSLSQARAQAFGGPESSPQGLSTQGSSAQENQGQEDQGQENQDQGQAPARQTLAPDVAQDGARATTENSLPIPARPVLPERSKQPAPEEADATIAATQLPQASQASPPIRQNAGNLNDLDFELALLTPTDAPAGASVNRELDLVSRATLGPPYPGAWTHSAEPALKTFPLVVFIEVAAGDTLSYLFQREGISIVETQKAGHALGEVFNLGALRPGQVIEVELDGAVERFGRNRLQRVSLSPTTLELIEVVAKDDGFVSKVSRIALTRVLVHASGALATGALYTDGKAMDIDGSTIANYVNALDAQVDFSQIQSVGDGIEMIYEAYFDDDGHLVDAGDVLYAAYHDQNGKTHEAFLFESNGKAAYFTRDARFTGQTNTLMRKPLGGGSISSKFGMRTHPVYGDRRMHNGVDYGASCGTPIYAAGDGVVSFAGWKGGYGRFIAVKHGSTYTTHYAHMRSFANGMRPGARVRKGQLIGRVGTTGVSTGCHLHYEVVKNGQHINPLSDHIPRGSDLGRAAKTRFLGFVSQLDSERERGVTLTQARARVGLL